MTRLSNEDPRRFPVDRLCGLLGRSRQSYYDRLGRDAALGPAVSEARVVAYIKEVRGKDPGIGINKIHLMASKGGLPGDDMVGLNRMYSIARANGLLVREKPRPKPRTTDSGHPYRKYPNLVTSFIPTAPNQLWVSDITYIELWVGEKEYVFCYLTIVMDAYSRMIKGWDVSGSLETVHALGALEMAVGTLGGAVPPGLIHHSDRGVQYASFVYVEYLRSLGMAISMTESGNPKDNPMAERINETVKRELLLGLRPDAIAAARSAIGEAIRFYNYERPHMSIDNLTPAEAENRTGLLRKRWRSFRDEAIIKDLKKDAQTLMLQDYESADDDMPLDVFLGVCTD